MKNVLQHGVVLIFCTLLASCELLCQAGTGTCGMSREQMEKLLHPKAYGEYWTKPGMTKESWRQDWVACGGMNDGNYVAGPRFPGETGDIAASSRKARQLDACMREKGYAFSYSPPSSPAATSPSPQATTSTSTPPKA